MIVVKYRLLEHYTYLSVSGHAQYADYGKDIVCAGVSAIVFGLMNALEDIEKVDISNKKNRIVINNASESIKVDHYFELVLTQLEAIEVSYGQFIKIERN